MTRLSMSLHPASKIQGDHWFSVLLVFVMAPHSSAKIMSALLRSFGGAKRESRALPDVALILPQGGSVETPHDHVVVHVVSWFWTAMFQNR